VSDFLSKTSQLFSDTGDFDFLAPEEVRDIDAKIRSSGLLARGSLNFSSDVACKSIDPRTCQEAAKFIEENTFVSRGSKVAVLEDSDDHGFTTQLGSALEKLEEIHQLADGHLYFVENENSIFAIVKIPLWTSVRI
jgi:hypothetical protein